MQSQYEDTIIPGEIPTISRRYTNGEKEVYTGDRAMAMSDLPGARAWQFANPDKFLANNYGPEDMRSTLPYRIGTSIRNKMQGGPGVLGRFMEGGPLSGGIAGAAAGAGGGALLGFLKKILTGNDNTSVASLATMGGLLGGLAGAHNGYVRATTKNTVLQDLLDKAALMSKSAATYQDPRNFILEKLQGATDVSLAEKVKLAAGVKQLDRDTAEKLAAAVRAALSFSVGAIIAKFLGASGTGALFGGLAGMFGTNFVVNTFSNNKPSSAPFDFTFRSLSYKDIL